MIRSRSDGRIRDGEGGAATLGGRSGLRRLISWVLLVGGLLLLLLVVAAVTIGVLLVTNADAALAWVNGVLDQLRPIISVLPQQPGDG